MTDIWLGVAALALVVGTVGVALWPPHHHRYTHPVGEIEHKKKQYQIIECHCGSQRWEPTAKEKT